MPASTSPAAGRPFGVPGRHLLEAAEQLAALPAHLLADYARVLDAITAAPWDGAPHNPDAEVRRWLFGPLGMGNLIDQLCRGRDLTALGVRVWA